MTEAKTSHEFQKRIGGKLRTLRREAGLSQRDLALKVDVSHQQIQKYERGENALPLERIRTFAEALGVSPGVLAFPETGLDEVAPKSRLSLGQSELLRLYDAIPDRESRRRLLDLVKTLQLLVKRLI